MIAMKRFSHQQGFTLIEVLVLIIVTALMMSTFLVGANTAMRNTPTVHQQWVAVQTAQQCIEYFVNQQRINGYASLTCPSSSAPTACSAPSGFSIAVNIACTTWDSDANFKTITATVSGNAHAVLALQVGNY